MVKRIVKEQNFFIQTHRSLQHDVKLVRYRTSDLLLLFSIFFYPASRFKIFRTNPEPRHCCRTRVFLVFQSAQQHLIMPRCPICRSGTLQTIYSDLIRSQLVFFISSPKNPLFVPMILSPPSVLIAFLPLSSSINNRSAFNSSVRTIASLSALIKTCRSF